MCRSFVEPLLAAGYGKGWRRDPRLATVTYAATLRISRMSLKGRRRLLTIFTDTGQPALMFVRLRMSYQSGSSGIRRSNSHPS